MNKEESIQQIETLIEAWQLDEADLNQTDINAMQSLLKENQMLKEKFKATNKGLQKVVLKRKKWKHRYQLARCEIKELKKQLEEYQLQNINLREDIMIQKIAFPNKLIKDKTFYNLYDMPTYEELLAQQKEFINYLEDNWKQTQDIWYIKILQKYKEIIGDDK